MNPEERRQFVRDHRTAVLGYARRTEGPAMSIVYYVMDGDDILVSTMADRAKAKAVARNPKISLCVLDEQCPPTYLQVYCDAAVETDPDVVVDVMMGVAGVMTGSPIDESLRGLVAEGAVQEDRVVLRCRPTATFETPPRHAHTEEDLPTLTHWTSASIPWGA